MACCTVERLILAIGLTGSVRGKQFKTTAPDDEAFRPADLVKRNFSGYRPNELWIADLSYVSTWHGLAYVAFVIDDFVGMIVCWWLSNSLRTGLPLTALEQAIHARQDIDHLLLHSDHGSQYLSIRYTERLADTGIEPRVGVGAAYDNVMAESVIGLYKTEVIKRRGPWNLPP